MRQFSGWMMAILLCCASEGRASEGKQDARLIEAQAVFDEATKLKEAGKYSEALAKAEHALSLNESVFGGTHPDVASCLMLVGDIYHLKGELSHVEPLFQRALAIREASLGKSHPKVAASLNMLANLYSDQGLPGQAEPLYRRALTIWEADPDKSRNDVAFVLNNLAILYFDQGLYGQAEPLYQRALSIWEDALGKSHPNVALALANLANLYYRQGLYSRAEPLHQRALTIREAALGKSHPNVASSLNNLANLYSDQGLYGRAEPLYQRALAIWEATLDKRHPRIALAFDNLALLYKNQGLYGRAEPLFQRALAIREASLGKSHPVVALSLNHLAAVYSDQGLYGQARPLFQRALAIWETSLGKNHPDVALALTNLGTLYADQGLYGRAKPLFQRALAIWETSLGKNHPGVASSLNNLAALNLAQGLYRQAEPLYLRALALWEASLGHDHPFVAEVLSELGKLRLAQHRLSDTLPLLSRSFSISEQRLRHEALDFSESRLSSFLTHLRVGEQRLYSLLRAYPQDTRVQRLALSAALLLKGRSVSETASISHMLYRSLAPEDRDTFERLRRLRTQLATLSFSGPGEFSSKDYQNRIQSLTQEGNSLEADLAKRSAPLRALSSLPSPSDIVGRVASSVPKDAALVEFIAYRDIPLASKPETPPAKIHHSMRYMALVLFPDASSRAVDLGPAAPIDQAALRLRDALAEKEVSFLPAAQRLYQLAFRPLLPLLGSTRRLFLAPDGQLNLIPFSALHDGQDFLLDSFDFTYLTSGRELLTRPQDSAHFSSVIVFADPDFTTASSAHSSPLPSSASSPPSKSLERFFSIPRPELVRSAWVPLPGARMEAHGIQRLLPQAHLFLGPDASKQRLVNIATPGILHLATHGFFLGDSPSAPTSRGLALVDSLGSAPPPQAEPLLNSGLVLAGALATGSGSLPSEATLITALELAGLNLWGTQLVVLSACDTGRGQVQLGQGVYGLRRALVAAGAETILVSLWKVNDDSTRLLMDLYYRNLLAGMGRASALREAMLSLRTTHPHPHSWAPFIALGSNEPLRAIAPSAPQTQPPEIPQ
ncbi:CHAT domain-containing protein [Stigmatella erecta]|uniref:CHAT domain-containing protein n=1 Tax=Stigmatella erecta TaxID=83460 RepID=A0A1I0JWP9_9BACT|nr:tetratricopeptide repeat protein [Stigmatella erecta]SEU15252.1 CHAT domain-containing protein [Stigmatella erecta]